MRIWPLFWRLCEFPARCWWRLRLALKVRGLDRLPDGAVLLCAKHSSAFDILLLGHLCRVQRRTLAHFQMGSFIGYRWLGPISPCLRRLGGFPVMRPKEVRRLVEHGTAREAALERMRAVNAEAELTRMQVLRTGGILVVFPEGTRDEDALRPLRSTLEVESALRAVADGVSVCVVPVAISYALPRLLRRRVTVEFCAGFAPAGTAAEVLDQVQAALQEHWKAPAAAEQESGATT